MTRFSTFLTFLQHHGASVNVGSSRFHTGSPITPSSYQYTILVTVVIALRILDLQ
jgi:hypothetical protein